MAINPVQNPAATPNTPPTATTNPNKPTNETNQQAPPQDTVTLSNAAKQASGGANSSGGNGQGGH